MLKSLDAVTTPDGRYASMAGPSGVLPITLADHHASIAKISISQGAPEDVRRVFSWSLNIMLYSWFDYELSVVAVQQMFGALEMALRQKLENSERVKKRQADGGGVTLKPLIDIAIKEGFLPLELRKHPFIENIPHLRNTLAHGNAMIGTHAMMLPPLQRCAELINFLYPIVTDPS
jgi:hypothetical protein